MIEGIVKEGIEDGEFYDGNVEAIAAGIFGVTTSSLIYRLRMDREVDVQKIYDGFIDTVVRGLIKNK